MPQYQLFIIRAIIGLGVAALLTRIFFQEIQPIRVVGLAIILVGLSYFSEYLRNRKKR